MELSEKEDSCDSNKGRCSGAENSNCCNSEETRLPTRLGKSSYKEADGVKGVCCASTASVPNGCSKAVRCNGTDSCSKEGLPSSDRTAEKAGDAVDIEKSGVVLEHVVLNVRGLTCAGCETKLYRSLHNLPGVLNLHTSLVLSQAEFDLDETAGPVIAIIRSVEKATGFACQKLNTEGQDIDVFVGDDARRFVERKYPDGVIEMIAIDKQIVRITYDARVIGARTLLETYSDRSLRLAVPRGSSELESGRKHLRSTAWLSLLSVILTIPVLVLAWAPLPSRPIVYGGVSLALATIVQFAVAGPFYPSALRALVFTYVIEMDLLIVLSTSMAYIFSVVSFVYQVVGQPLPTGEFFETSTLLVTLIMLARLVSAFARQKAVESVSIRSLQAATAVIIDADGRDEQEIDARLLQHGDLFKVMPDSRIATDGTVVSGTTEVDESMVTGESQPVLKVPGSSVVAGSLNGSGVIVVRLKHLPGHNTISIIAAMVDEAKFSKPKTQELVDRVASYFVPVILSLTLVTFVVWIAIGLATRHQNGGPAAINALTYAISVLVVSCPCAIGLAVPMVVVISGGVAAKHGVVFKSACAIEAARKASHVVFDKTGTLTKGEMSVLEEIYLSKTPESAASITLGLTCNSKHPISAAISSYLKGKRTSAAIVENAQSIISKGIEGSLNGINVRCGNTHWLSAGDQSQVQDLLSRGLTVVGVTRDDQLIAIYGLSDSLRADSHFVVAELQRRNIAVSIVSGDDASAVNTIVAKLNVPATHVRSRCTPKDKQEYLKTLMAAGDSTIIFCGDGTNDAVALAQADIGIHMNSGSDVAQTAADVVLLRSNLGGILVLLDLSKVAFHRICFNFVWSFVYNLFAILLAAGAFVNARIPPQYAGLGEIVSVLPVILIALQLRWFKRDY
jgi:Cd2+-exporting ATPase